MVGLVIRRTVILISRFFDALALVSELIFDQMEPFLSIPPAINNVKQK